MGGYDKSWYEEEREYIAIEAIILCILIIVAIIFETIHHKVSHIFARSHEEKIQIGKIVPTSEETPNQELEAAAEKAKKSKGSKSLFGTFKIHNPLKKKHEEAPINYVAEAKKNSYGKRLFHRCEAEIMVLGILALCVWFSNKCGAMKLVQQYNTCNVDKDGCEPFGPENYSDMLHTVEDVHMHLFFGMILYFLCIARIMKHSKEKMSDFEKFENKMDKEVLAKAKDAIKNGQDAKALSEEIVIPKQSSNPICGKTDDYAEYLLIRKYFIEFVKNNGLGYELEGFKKYNESSFPFNDYMLLAFDKDVDEFIIFKKTSWLSVMIVYVMIALIAWFNALKDDMTTLSSRIFIMLSVVIISTLMVTERFQAKKMMKDVQTLIEENEAAAKDIEAGKQAEAPTVKIQNNSCFLSGEKMETILLQSMQSLLFYCSYYTSRWFLRLIADAEKFDATDTNVWIEMIITIVMQLLCQFVVPKWYPRYCVIMALPPNFDAGDSGVLEKALVNWEAHYKGEQEYIEELMKAEEVRRNTPAEEVQDVGDTENEAAPLVINTANEEETSSADVKPSEEATDAKTEENGEDQELL